MSDPAGQYCGECGSRNRCLVTFAVLPGAHSSHALERAGEVAVTGETGLGSHFADRLTAATQQPLGDLHLFALEVLLGADDRRVS